MGSPRSAFVAQLWTDSQTFGKYDFGTDCELIRIGVTLGNPVMDPLSRRIEMSLQTLVIAQITYIYRTIQWLVRRLTATEYLQTSHPSLLFCRKKNLDSRSGVPLQR